jgi:SAM-dependent methyltransferase
MHRIDLASHNWLVYKINNDSFLAHAKHIRGRVIDLGCGLCPYRADILSLANEYIGVDWDASYHSDEFVDIKTDLSQRLPFDEGYADTIVAFQVLEHLPDPCGFLSECFRVLNSDGVLYMTVPFMWPLHESPYDYYRYTCYGLAYLLKRVGFDVIEITKDTGFWQTFVLRFNYHTHRFARGPLRYIFIPIWFTGQILAPLLDRIDGDYSETGMISVIAVKPA